MKQFLNFLITQTRKLKYDLEERVARFGEEVIGFTKTLDKGSVNNPLISHFVRSATSIGANYMEANQASSKKDFRNKIYICRKEANETKHWLRMLASANEDKINECRKLWDETHQLTLIFAKITSSLNEREGRV